MHARTDCCDRGKHNNLSSIAKLRLRRIDRRPVQGLAPDHASQRDEDKQAHDDAVRGVYTDVRQADADVTAAEREFKKATSSRAEGAIKTTGVALKRAEYGAKQAATRLQRLAPKDCFGHCTLCELWSETTFRYAENVSGPAAKHVYLHLDFERWAPTMMERTTEHAFTLTCPLPPGERQYYFSVDCRKIAAVDQPKSAPALPPSVNDARTLSPLTVPPAAVNTVNVPRRAAPITPDVYADLCPAALPRVQGAGTGRTYMVMSNSGREHARENDALSDAYGAIGEATLAKSGVEAMLAMDQGVKAGGAEAEYAAIKRVVLENYLELRTVFQYHSVRSTGHAATLVMPWGQLLALTTASGVLSEMRYEDMSEYWLKVNTIDAVRLARGDDGAAAFKRAAFEGPGTCKSGGVLSEAEFLFVIIKTAMDKYKQSLVDDLAPWQQFSRLVQTCLRPYVEGDVERAQSPDYFREHLMTAKRVMAPFHRRTAMVAYVFDRYCDGKAAVDMGCAERFARHNRILDEDVSEAEGEGGDGGTRSGGGGDGGDGSSGAGREKPKDKLSGNGEDGGGDIGGENSDTLDSRAPVVAATGVLDEAAMQHCFTNSLSLGKTLSLDNFIEFLARLAQTKFSKRRELTLPQRIGLLLALVEERNTVPRAKRTARSRIRAAKAFSTPQRNRRTETGGAAYTH